MKALITGITREDCSYLAEFLLEKGYEAHVISALIRRIHEAKQADLDEVVIWETGSPKRELLHVDDMAAASVFVMNLDKGIYDGHTEPMQSHINVGTGIDCSILEVAQTIADVVGFKGMITTDPSKPDGAQRKLMSVDRLRQLGWEVNIELESGLKNAYEWFQLHQINARGLTR